MQVFLISLSGVRNGSCKIGCALCALRKDCGPPGSRLYFEAMSIQVAKRLFTVDEYYRMAEAGILAPDDRVELIEGEIIRMSAMGCPHMACIDRLAKQFFRCVGDLAIVRIQGPVRLSDYTEPEPDVSLLKPRADYYETAHPGPADVLLIVEVSHSSLEFDQVVKQRIYVEAGIPEYWILNLPGQSIVTHRDPSQGKYLKVEEFPRGQILTPRAFPDCAMAVDEVLGAAHLSRIISR